MYLFIFYAELKFRRYKKKTIQFLVRIPYHMYITFVFNFLIFMFMQIFIQ